MAFIFAFALSQFESIHAESVEADMTDAKNAETVLADTKEELGAQAEPQVAGCKTHAEAVEELTEALDKKVSSLNEKNDDYTLRVSKVKEPRDNQNQDKGSYDVTYQLSLTVLNKEKKFEEVDMSNLAGIISDLYKENKIDKLRFKLKDDEDISLKDTLQNIREEEYKAAINDILIENMKKAINIPDGEKLGNMTRKSPGVRIAKKTCENKEAYIWIGIPIRNSIAAELRGKIEGKDITVDKNAIVNWRDGAKIKDSVADPDGGYQKYINNATAEDLSGRDTKTSGVKNGNIKLKFTDDTELTINQNLIVKRDHLDDELDRRQEEQRRQEKQRENERKRNTRQERLKRQEREDKEAKAEEKTIAKQEMVAKKDYGIVNATALKLVTQQDIPQGQSGEAITEMLRRGVLNGVSSAEFAPKLTVSRAMLAQVLMNISTDKTVGMIELKDLKGDEWYADAITWAVTHGIFKGYPDGSFKAEQKLTREEVASVLYSFLKDRGIDMPEVQDFTYDDNISAWSKEAVTKLAKLGLVNGKSETNYQATSEFTREELAVALYKIINWVMSQSI